MLLLATHPGFVKPMDGLYYENSGHGYYDILMEHCGRSLSDLKFEKTTSIEAKVDWLKQCAEAMAFAESKSIYHGDIKPQNLMIKGGITLKLIDLGGSRSMGTTTYAKTIVQVTKKVKELTPCYAALELLEGRDPIIMNKLDVYAFAKTFYEICYNKTSRDLDQERLKLCFSDPASRYLRTNEEEYNAWTKELLNKTLPDDGDMTYSKIVNQVLFMCLQYRPDKRPSFAEIRAFLQLEMQPLKMAPLDLLEYSDNKEVPVTVKYKGKEKPEDEELKINELYINPYDNSLKIINFYSDLKIAMVIDLEGEGPIDSRKKIYGALLSKDSPQLPSMAQSIMTNTNKCFLLGGKYIPAYSNSIYELFISEAIEKKQKKPKKTTPNWIIKVDKKTAFLKFPRVLFGLVSSKNSIYLLGGSTIGDKLLRECEQYNIIENTIKEIPPLTERKEGVSTCTYQDRWIYVFGGRLQNFAVGSDMLDNFSSLIEQYDMEKQMWTQVLIDQNSIYKGSTCSGSCEIEINKIILFGGIMWKNHEGAEGEAQPSRISMLYESLDYTVKTRELSKSNDIILMATDYIGPVYCVKEYVFAFNSLTNPKSGPALYSYNKLLKEWKVNYFANN